MVMEQDYTGQNYGAIDFTKMTTATIREELKSRNANGFSRKNKAELIEQLKQILQKESMEY